MKKKPINKIRVVIPNNPKDKLDLATKVDAKNTEMGSDSPLKTLTWSEQGPHIAEALEFHNQAEELVRQAEKIFEKRDLLIEPIDDLLRQSRDMLKAAYRAEPRRIGDFGYEVNDTPV
jgi:hypothetical protein